MTMTNDELRALADALSRQRQADEHGIYCAVPRQAVDAAIKYLRAQADAQPVAAVPAGWKWVPVEPTREMIFAAQQYHEGEAYLPFSLYKSMLAAAPAAPQAEPKREPLSEATALIEWPESAKWKNRAAPEGIERSCMAEPKREPLSDERIAEIQRAAYERAAQECIETAAELRRCADGCTDGRYDWKADGADDCADAIRALGGEK